MAEIIVGIDLGTTNSEIATFIDGAPRVLGKGSAQMLPSCVGLSLDGKLLIGQAALNQALIYPERTARSVKRMMGTSQKIKLGDREFSPQEISALILKELVSWAEARLGQKVSKAVITVPAYFSDAQRNATREAGTLAGLDVVRMVNEPTAASLAYGIDTQKQHTVMIYDLGGGTLDVSIVRLEQDITEVLSSSGDNHLGGDDFDQLLVNHLVSEFHRLHGINLMDQNPGAYARLWWAAETAKKKLSFEPYARIQEESLISVNGQPLHLDIEVSREQYEQMIQPLIDKSIACAHKALQDAGMVAGGLDEILLVGGSTRTPLVIKSLQKLSGKPPRQDLHPDLCVALGAGVLASRLAGHDVPRLLVDVSPYSFGPGFLGELNGQMYPHCYRAIITRNTPLPVTRTEEYFTASDYQTAVDVNIYQGENPDALRNVPVGQFRIEGLQGVEGPNSVLCKMKLDLDGILHVTAIEKKTGLSKHVSIRGATQPRDATAMTQGQETIKELFGQRVQEEPLDEPAYQEPPQEAQAPLPAASSTGESLIARARELMEKLHADDREEAINLIEAIETAQSPEAAGEAIKKLEDFLYFVEGS